MSFLTQVGQGCLHGSEDWRQRPTDTQVHWETGKWKKKEQYKNRSSPCSTQNVLKSATVHIEGSLTHATDVDRPAELVNGVAHANTEDGSSTSPTRSTIRHSSTIASERPRKRRTPWPSWALNSTASSSENRKYPAATVAKGHGFILHMCYCKHWTWVFFQVQSTSLWEAINFTSNNKNHVHFLALFGFWSVHQLVMYNFWCFPLQLRESLRTQFPSYVYSADERYVHQLLVKRETEADVRRAKP